MALDLGDRTPKRAVYAPRLLLEYECHTCAHSASDKRVLAVRLQSRARELAYESRMSSWQDASILRHDRAHDTRLDMQRRRAEREVIRQRAAADQDRDT